MKSTCAYCAEVTECSCPDCTSEKSAGAKFVCSVCTALMDQGVPQKQLKDPVKRAEIRRQLSIELLAEMVSERAMEDCYPQIWSEDKGWMSKLPKDELAAESFFSGMNTMAVLLFTSMKDEEIGSWFPKSGKPAGPAKKAPKKRKQPKAVKA